MTKNEASPAQAASDTPSPQSQRGGVAPSSARKASFEDLASEKKRREATLIKSARIAAGVVGVVIMVGGILFLLPSGGSEDGEVANTQVPELPKELSCDDTSQETPEVVSACTKRTEFQAKYRELTTEMLPALEAASGEEFVQNALRAIQEQETLAIQAFDRSDFATAVISLDQALIASAELEKSIAEEFSSSLGKAQNAFTEENPAIAAKWAERATRLAPQNTEAALLSQRVSVLPEVLTLRQKAAEAAVQNQLLDQYKYLEKIVSLDPARQEIRAQLSSLGERISQIRYNEYMKQAGLLIEGNSLQAARASLKKASSIYPDKDDVLRLTKQIDELEKKQRITAMLAAANELESQDQWPGAIEIYGQILAEDPANLPATNGLDKATRTVSANNRAVEMLNNQHRMQDARINQRMLEFVDEIKPLARDSATLNKTVLILEQTLTLWLKDKKVTVLSDGKSMVKVRRVGVVGVTRSKDIQLRPGNYEFECTRQGYRSKIVPHYVPPDQDTSSVTVTCDVPI